ncbi:hypothetical protein [Cytobacillus gottheilii]|uniref:hypothetical protein n=1 Tax=Cytobacillus gottheilii TaxID=859144 RepID=UPI00111B3560|nr:hypothetical protein [Cytobacillus gottheilii]
MFILSIIGSIIGAIISATERKKVKDGLNVFLKEHSIVDYYGEYYSAGNHFIIHDRSNGMFCVYGDGYNGRYYHEITKVELVIDDTVAYQSSLSSAVGRAVVGGVLAGGVGAVIGGVTGKKMVRK